MYELHREVMYFVLRLHHGVVVKRYLLLVYG